MLGDLKDKKILILGFGKEGRDTYLALRKIFPAKILAVADKNKNLKIEKDKNLKLYLGENYLDKIGEYEVIIKTPGIAPKELGSLRGKEPSSQTEIFFDNFPGLIIGVTGTKGKGTTSSLIYEILKKAGLRVYLGGNIGKPVLQYLLKAKPEDIFVYELSSHQLQNLKKSPQIAVFLNLFPDHLDYYKNFTEYQNAKSNIAKFQTKNDYLIFNGQNKQVKEISQKAKSHKINFSQDKEYYKTLLPGEFNQLNIKAAVKVAELFKIKPEIIKSAVKNFKGLPHRLQFVGKFKGIDFYNNSMATIPAVTIQDLKTFNNKSISLIFGGSDKGSDYSELVKEIKKTSVNNLIILGQGTGQKIARALEGTRFLRGAKEPSSFEASSMREAVKICYEKTPRNGVCLLSPASASFNLFKDYQDRGNQFIKYIKSNAKKT
jgi:UDP-N-acetylmuramoyl-L-alanine---L-glutamate ligase